MTKDVTFEAVKTPASLPDEAFALKFHHNTPMTDHLRRTLYEVDESGQRVSPEKPLTVVPSRSDSAGGSEQELRTDTEREPRRITPWIVLGSSVSVLAGVAVYTWRKRRALRGASA